MQEENNLDEAFDENFKDYTDEGNIFGDNIETEEEPPSKPEDENEDSVWGDSSTEYDEIPERPYADDE